MGPVHKCILLRVNKRLKNQSQVFSPFQLKTTLCLHQTGCSQPLVRGPAAYFEWTARYYFLAYPLQFARELCWTVAPCQNRPDNGLPQGRQPRPAKVSTGSRPRCQQDHRFKPARRSRPRRQQDHKTTLRPCPHQNTVKAVILEQIFSRMIFRLIVEIE